MIKCSYVIKGIYLLVKTAGNVGNITLIEGANFAAVGESNIGAISAAAATGKSRIGVISAAAAAA